MKRIHLSLMALGLINATTVLAALPTPTNTESSMITVPALYGNFIVGGTFYYLEPVPTNGDLDFASVSPLLQGTTAFPSHLHSSGVGYDWQYGFNLGYIFSDTANDVELNYLFLSTQGSDLVGSVLRPVNINNIPNLQFNSQFFQNGIDRADAIASYRANVLDLIAGQYIDVGCRLRLHPTAGVRYIDFERNLHSIYVADQFSTNNPSGLIEMKDDSDYSGIGPMVGLDASYYLGMGFGVVGHTDTAITIGSLNYNTDLAVTTVLNGNTPGLFQGFEFEQPNYRLLVPIVDAKLGLDYTYMFYSMTNDDLTIEAGYALDQYFNVLDRFTKTTQIGNPNIPILGAIVNTKSSSVGLNGPYVNITFHV